MGFFSSKPNVNKARVKIGPWKPQQEYLKTGFEQARGALGTALGSIPKDTVAGMTPGQISDLGALSGLGRSAASDAQGQIQGGQVGMGAVTPGQAGVNPMADYFDANARSILTSANNPTAINQASALYNDAGEGYAGRANSVFRTAGQESMAASRRLLDFASGGPQDSRANQVFSDVSGDKTSTIVNNAGAFASNPYLDSQIDAALKDINRNFQIERGNINSNAVGAGAINSTRAATMEAYAQKDAMDRAAALAANMRGDAYDRGLALASRGEEVRQGNTLSANAQLQGDDDYRLRAGLGAAGQLTSAESYRDSARLGASGQLASGAIAGDNARLAANSQLIDALNSNIRNALAANEQVGQGADRRESQIDSSYNRFGMGQDITNRGYEAAFRGLTDSLAAGDRSQAQTQAEIEGRLREMGIPLDLIQQYMATVGGQYGQKGWQQQVTKGTASPFQQLVGGGASLLGAIGSFRKP